MAISLEVVASFRHPLLAFRVILCHEALGVPPCIDGGWVELPVPHRLGRALMSDHTRGEYCSFWSLHSWRLGSRAEPVHWIGEVTIVCRGGRIHTLLWHWHAIIATFHK